MLALYRSGRQAEALERLPARARELLEELGLEPGEELRRLEQAILRQDPALELAAERGAPVPASRRAERSILVVPRRRRTRWPLLDLAAPLATAEPPRELIVASVVEPGELGAATAALAATREALSPTGSPRAPPRSRRRPRRRTSCGSPPSRTSTCC